MSYSTFIAKRYLHSGRNQGFFSFITAISIMGVMLGTATLIIALSVLGGFEREITEKVIGFTSHVQVLGFQNQPLKNYEESIGSIRRSIPVVTAVSPFVAREALIRARDEVDGILLKGIDPDNDVSTTRRYMVTGLYDFHREQGALPRLVVGKKLAAKLAIDVNDKVTIFGIGRYSERGQARVMQFTISGIYESGMAEYDDIYAFTDLADAQTLFQVPDAVTGYDLMLASVDSAESVSDQVQELL